MVVDLTDTDPDDAFSEVPYEKGAAFLWYLEELVGGPGNDIYFKFLSSSFSSFVIQLSYLFVVVCIGILDSLSLLRFERLNDSLKK